MKFSRMLGIALGAAVAVGSASAQSWTPVNNVPNIGAGAISLDNRFSRGRAAIPGLAAAR